jgi:hypothetical protein
LAWNRERRRTGFDHATGRSPDQALQDARRDAQSATAKLGVLIDPAEPGDLAYCPTAAGVKTVYQLTIKKLN